MKMEFPVDISTLRFIRATHSLRIISAWPCPESMYGWKILSFDSLND
jgi:hypothetical protein